MKRRAAGVRLLPLDHPRRAPRAMAGLRRGDFAASAAAAPAGVRLTPLGDAPEGFAKYRIELV